MAHLGNRTWIEADPNTHKVLEITLPTEIHGSARPGRFYALAMT